MPKMMQKLTLPLKQIYLKSAINSENSIIVIFGDVKVLCNGCHTMDSAKLLISPFPEQNKVLLGFQYLKMEKKSHLLILLE